MWRYLLIATVACASAPAEPLHTPQPKRRPLMAEPTPRPRPTLMTIDTVVDVSFPVELPVIKIDKLGGFTGNGDGGFSVWPDGTVQFRGSQCPNPRRGKVAAEHVHALVTELDQRGLLTRKAQQTERGCGYMLDGHYWQIVLRSGDRSNKLQGPDTAPNFTCAWVEDTLDAVRGVIGANPCAY